MGAPQHNASHRLHTMPKSRIIECTRFSAQLTRVSSEVDALSKEFEIEGCVAGVPSDMREWGFWDASIEFIESQGWSFGGGLEAERISGCGCVLSDDMTADEVHSLLSAWANKNSWSFECTVREYRDDE